jgi:hypothetical protein
MLVRGDEALAFLSNRTVISGLTVAVRTAIDCNIGVARAIDSESWFQHLRSQLTRAKGFAPPVAALYVRLQPATREALMREMGEGEALEEFAGRIDLGSDLDVTAIGNVRTELAGPGFGGAHGRAHSRRAHPAHRGGFWFYQRARFHALFREGNRRRGTLHISQRERAEISDRMAIVAETMATCARTKTEGEEDNHDRQRGPGNPAHRAQPGLARGLQRARRQVHLPPCAAFRGALPRARRDPRLGLGGDNASTAAALRALGVPVHVSGSSALVEGRGFSGLREAKAALDCGNSGTTMRLFCGLLAGRPFETTLTGDPSLSRRPMGRVAKPLRLMGARVEGQIDPERPERLLPPS